jgi:hypothetical protein
LLNVLRQFEGQYDCVDELKIDIKKQFKNLVNETKHYLYENDEWDMETITR